MWVGVLWNDHSDIQIRSSDIPTPTIRHRQNLHRRPQFVALKICTLICRLKGTPRSFKELTQEIGQILNCSNVFEDIEVIERRNKKIKHDDNLEIMLAIVDSFFQSICDDSNQR